MNARLRPARLAPMLAAALMLAAARPGAAQAIDELPADLEGVGVTQHLDRALPLDLPFVTHEGERVRLGDAFRHDRPVVITPVYYRCPMLCNETLNGLADAMAEMDLEPGADYVVFSFSIDAREEPELASAKRRGYLARLGRDDHGAWTFHVADQPSIDALTEAVGFRYNEVPGRQDFAHSACIVVCTPDGRISKYVNDIRPDPDTLRLALVEASEGRIGSLWDRFVLSCYVYDPDANSYVASAVAIMRVGGAVTILALVALVLVLKLREPRRPAPNAAPQTGGLQP